MRSLSTAALSLLMLTGCTEEEAAAPPADPLEFLKAAHVRDMADALAQAYEQFERRNHDACIALCNYVLSCEPDYGVAVEFAEDATRAKARIEEGDEFYFSFVMHKVNNWKKLTNSGESASVPYMDTLTYPGLGLTAGPKEGPGVYIIEMEYGWPPHEPRC
jgi:uncharacterized protein (UPF0297 family)